MESTYSRDRAGGDTAGLIGSAIFAAYSRDRAGGDPKAEKMRMLWDEVIKNFQWVGFETLPRPVREGLVRGFRGGAAGVPDDGQDLIPGAAALLIEGLESAVVEGRHVSDSEVATILMIAHLIKAASAKTPGGADE